MKTDVRCRSRNDPEEDLGLFTVSLWLGPASSGVATAESAASGETIEILKYREARGVLKRWSQTWEGREKTPKP